MPKYQMKVIMKTLTIEADNERQAEEKYDAYWFEEGCPCGSDNVTECGCIEVNNEPDHITEKVGN